MLRGFEIILVISDGKIMIESRRCPSLEMNTATRVQILDEIDCISHSTNTLGKGMNPIILPPAVGK